jgi:hypothetical protein
MIIFKSFEQAPLQWLAQHYQRYMMRRVVSQAYGIFAQRHPQEVTALFDEHFVLNHVLPLLQRAASTGEEVTTFQVAEVWTRQVSLLPTARKQHFARMIPAATDFLAIVADTLTRARTGQNVFVKKILLFDL